MQTRAQHDARSANNIVSIARQQQQQRQPQVAACAGHSSRCLKSMDCARASIARISIMQPSSRAAPMLTGCSALAVFACETRCSMKIDFPPVAVANTHTHTARFQSNFRACDVQQCARASAPPRMCHHLAPRASPMSTVVASARIARDLLATPATTKAPVLSSRRRKTHARERQRDLRPSSGCKSITLTLNAPARARESIHCARGKVQLPSINFHNLRWAFYFCTWNPSGRASERFV